MISKVSKLWATSLVLICSFFLVLSTPAYAQTTVSGVVTDSEGEPLVGAGVLMQGTTRGVVTDLDGRYEISVPSDAVLEFSFIGFKTEVVAVAGRSSLSVSLESDNVLEETVVIGYGTVKKKDLTGSVASVRGEDLAAKKTASLSTALQGTMSGVLVTRNGNAPGSGASSIRVRGITTMDNSNPLIIVDGVQCSDLDYVNSNDVQSISVLKDAAAASIYGAKAAAGVILVTTKRGEAAELSFTYNGEVGAEIPTTQPEMVGVTRFLEMNNELLYNDNNAAGFFQLYTPDQVKNWTKYHATDPDKYPITNWRELIMQPAALRHSHNASLSGGNKSVRSKVSMTYDDVDGLYGGRNYQRFMLRTNNDFTIIKDILHMSLDLNIRHAKNKRPIFTPWDTMRKMPAVYAATWSDGRYADGKSGSNPYALVDLGGDYLAWSTQLGGKFSIDITPVKGLKISAVVSPFINYTKAKEFKNACYYTLADDPDVIGGYFDSGTTWSTNKLSETRNDSWNVTSQVLANYNGTFGKHNLGIMAGFENYMMKSESLSAARDQYELVGYPYLNVGPEDYQTNSGSGEAYCSNSVFGRITYDFDGRYLFQANVRHDGSSRFSKKYRWGTFPSFSAGWVISKEKWMQSAQPYLTFLKLRASWGMLGNERIGSNYFPFMALMNFGNALFYNEGETVSDKTAAQRGLAVEDISWETTTSTDLGIDLGFFKNRLNASFDYYWKTTDDMLLSIEIPYMMGYANPKTNAGKMATHGFDLEASWSDRKGDFSYSIGANLSDFISKIVNINGADIISGGKIHREGYHFNEYYGYVCEGIYQTMDEVNNSARLNNSVTVGDLKYKDISGPDGVPDGKISAEYDRVPLGNSLPRFQFGLRFNCDWKGIDYSMVFQGIGKQNAYLSAAYVQPLRDNYGNIPSIIEGKYWSVFNTPEQNQAATYPRLTKVGKDNNYATSSFWMFQGGYLRMKNVTLGYTIPERLTSKARIKKLRFYVSANDLFCLSKYPKGWDPEMGTDAYPITTSVLGGVSIKF
ncbi:MAG: TonB-dependent receptor [Bacteroidales bacterium]|nr:TonB-dependent receptor [Bacteroidales bacterium]